MRLAKLQFSLRTLLALVACLAVVCVWRDRPRRIAAEFINAVNAGDYEAADLMIVDGQTRSITGFMERDDRNRVSAQRTRQSMRDWLKGRCIIAVDFVDFRGLGGDFGLHMVASSDGIRAADADVVRATRAKFINPPERAFSR
jgi:hypothetical protein